LADRAQQLETPRGFGGTIRDARWRAVAIAFAVLLGPAACTQTPTREVTLTARGMSFFTDEFPGQSNPLIRLHAGERVRLVLKNEAPGLLHDIEIPALEVQLDQIRAGETTDLTFTVPDSPGHHEYRCRPHAELMHGVVEVIQ
jgi:FtsP/CotA-like multicopper oxidase with cupredoxin domain